ncbi:MAG: hypothetical protein J0665_02245 [Deltaproteobacteria bacterium]|nr:hypothetical protein [Deltaproteobacteria bacterium]
MTTVQRIAIPSPASGLTVYDTDIKDLMIYNGTSWVASGSSMPAATSGQSGYLTAADWATFNAKTSTSSPTFTGTVTAPTFTGALTGNATTATSATTATTATSFSGALAGDVTGTQVATTVATVGGQTAANVSAGAVLANAATNLNTVSTIVKRDASGNFIAGNITAALSGNATTATSATSVTGTVGVANGGTGATTLTGYVKGSGTSAMTASATIPSTDISGLGTAATLNIGTAASNIVQLDGSAKLPAVDGSQLTAIKLLSDANFNVKAGTVSLNGNTTGNNNTAIGHGALNKNTSASANVAVGYYALMSQLYDAGSAYSSYNTGVGYASLMNNNPTSTTTGVKNTAFGAHTLELITTGANNIGIGYGAGGHLTTGNYNIDIGNIGVAAEANTIRIGDANQTKTFISGIYSVAGGGLTTPKTVVMGSDGQLGTIATTAAPSAATTVTTQAYSDAGTVGTATTYAREDHKHTFPASTKDTTAATGILKGNGSAVTAAVAGDFPTLNQNTTGTAANVTGTVAVANGGTGLNTVTSGSYLAGNGTGALTVKTPAQVKTDLAVTKSDVGLPNVEDTALSTWAGSTNITTLGTITTGTVPVARVSGLGSAATLNVGTAASNVVQLNGSAQLPAVDGSKLTNVQISSSAADNAKVGTNTLLSITSGVNNTALGSGALRYNTTGNSNTAVGITALSANTIGSNNVAAGNNALAANTASSENIALGHWSLNNQSYNNSGVAFSSYNIAIGASSLASNQPVSTDTGVYNIGIGADSLYNNTIGKNNIGIGYRAGRDLTFGNYNIDIGNYGVADEGNTIRIGDANQNRTFISGIYSVAGGGLTTPKTVVMGSDGQLGSVASTSGTVTNVTVGTGLNITNGSTTPDITLGTVPVANGGTGLTSVGTSGQVLTSSGSAASWATLPNSTWNSIVGTSQTIVANTGYVATSAALTTFTLPVAPNVGERFSIVGSGTGGWQIDTNGMTILSTTAAGVDWRARMADAYRYWTGVASSGDGSKLVAVVDGTSDSKGFIYTSTDSGVTWTERLNDLPRRWLSVASSIDGSKLVAVARNEGIYTSSDSGVTWTIIYTSAKYWKDVASSDDGSKLVAVVKGEYIYISTDSGVTWAVRMNDLSRQWIDVASSSDGTKLAAVVYGGYLYTSTDSGITWTPQMTGSPVRNWYSVASSSDGSKLVAIVENGYIYTSTDSGVTWTERMNDMTRTWETVASSSDGTKLLAQVYKGYLYTSIDSGVTWTARMNDTSRAWTSLASSSDGNKLVSLENNGYLYTSALDTTTNTKGGQGSTLDLVYVGNNQYMAATAGLLPVSQGGTGASDAPTARINLGLAVNISGKLPAVDGSLLTKVQLQSDSRDNTMGGSQALFSDTAGYENTALGYSALGANTGASSNVAIGAYALSSQKFYVANYPSRNTAIGSGSLRDNNPTSVINGIRNTALGAGALIQNKTGSYNIGIGDYAGSMLTTGDYNIHIGHDGYSGEGNTIRIGDWQHTKTFISGIYSVAGGGLTTPKTVVMGLDGQLGTVTNTSGTVTSVDVSGGTTGLTTSGGPVTGSGTITLAGTLAVANGGTGATTLTGYVKGSATSAMTASATIPSSDITGLGTAAALNVGTATNNVVQLDGPARLPSLDASQLTSVPAPWTGIITAATLTPIRNLKYLLVHATLPVAVTLPAAGTLSIGDTFRFMGGPNGFSVKSTDCTIYSVDLTVNIGGTVTFTAKGAAIELVYVAANTFYIATNAFSTGSVAY